MPGERPGGYWRDVLRRFARDRVAWITTGVIAAYLLAALLAPWIAPYDPLKTALQERLRGPYRDHWLGQDEVGRDVLSRIIYGGRVSLGIGLLSVLIGVTVGGLLGLIAGFYRPLDNAIMRVLDIIMVFPFILRAIAVVAILGPGFVNLFIAIGFGQIPTNARLVRSLVLGIKEEVFVEAARALGARDRRLLVQHIVPQMVAPVTTYSTLEMGSAILGAATLSFLGLGINPPTPEWGAIASAGREFMRTAPHLVVFPSLAIFLAVWSFNVLGDVLRDAMDPKLRSR
jgi:peptide/nickel transport system permease protein